MILIFVPNPSLDKTVVLPDFAPGHTFRPAEVLTLAGGKGCNFARALHTLGEQSLLVGPIGGYAGERLLDLAAQDGLACERVPVQGELRTCLTIIDPEHAHRITEIYEQGMALQAGEWDALTELVARHFSRCSDFAVCGSFPPGMPERGLYSLLERAKAAGLPLLLDTYGPQLDQVLELGPDLLKVNQVEAGSMVGMTITNSTQALIAALLLKKRGARQVVITLGKPGAVGLTSEGYPFGWAAPEVASICPTGSGDCLFAGIVAGLKRGQALPDAVRLGVAAGAANTLQIGAGRLEASLVEKLYQSIQPLRMDG